jgi:hypothetical protein
MFEGWARTMGGILEAAGIHGFLGNLQEFYAAADTDGATWRSFVAAWWQQHRENKVTAGELFQLAVDAGMELGEKSEQSQKIRLGKRLSEARDRVFSIDVNDNANAKLRLENAGEFRRAATWKLITV